MFYCHRQTLAEKAFSNLYVGFFQANPTPVSYTHLDVYKRQLFSYVLDTRSFLLTGGDFGVEASVPALAAYLLFAALALGLMRRRKRR